MLTNKAARLLTILVTAALVAGCTQSAQDLRKAGDVQGLVERLGPETATEERADAATALGELAAEQGPQSVAAAEALDHLVVALGDADPVVRAAAVRGLGGLGVGAALTPILGAVADESAQVQAAAAQALPVLLGDLDPETANGILLNALDDRSTTIRAEAVACLGEVGTRTAILPLLGALDDSAGPVRAAASTAVPAVLGRISATDATDILLDAIDEASDTVRAAAVQHLGLIGTSTAILPLLKAAGDPAAPVRSAAQTAVTAVLDRLSDGAAVRALFDATASDDTAAQSAATDALGLLLVRFGPKRAATAVTDAQAPDSWLAVALGVPVSKLAAETRRLGFQLEPLDAIRNAARAAAKRTAVVGSHRYVASGAFHPAIVLAPSLQDKAHANWSPTALRFLELVVTEKASWKKIQVCRYYGPDITRYRAVVTLTVISGYTGKVVATKAYTGPAPRACRRTEPYNLTRLEGGAPNLGPAITWLNSLIHPPS
jgi:HEAT repeat protein